MQEIQKAYSDMLPEEAIAAAADVCRFHMEAGMAEYDVSSDAGPEPVEALHRAARILRDLAAAADAEAAEAIRLRPPIG